MSNEVKKWGTVKTDKWGKAEIDDSRGTKLFSFLAWSGVLLVSGVITYFIIALLFALAR